MNSLWGAELHYTPDYWPAWLIIAGMLVVGLLAVLALHGLMRCWLAPKSTSGGVEEKTYLYSKAVRFWHWGNALLFILLLVSGLFNHFSIGNVAAQVALHEICGYLLLAFWIGFVVINMIGGNGVHYRIRSAGLVERSLRQARFYLFGIMKGESHPFPATAQGKFNPLQQLAYVGVMYLLVPLLLLTGLLCLFPDIVGNGYWMLKAHLVLAIAGLLFICGHFYLCTTGDTPTQTFRSMVDGYHRHRHQRNSE
ncbi:thiosulfate reductase cytochrome B subunit [Leminorella grimontii]|uniref:Thiosulfate reductase cytochrome B subunit n=1 Tax=Leminorella grimontii TaxID=82981 RepID=A0AAV5MZN8_9GAMM|nr:thiosulfate reductase cytochrome B subunit [Leminorella grimontii]KFC96549.1 thiosulfate reductase cytochrome B subunit [Leminorella grimontii ATCC 33999 = DSM 5078]GKX54254.1 thiosulfate reductase cytochrome B subunit [Leminorella grimontii]VFS59667.1 thiosulfate reductase cytochrome B subunit [Leminorella grimontii]